MILYDYDFNAACHTEALCPMVQPDAAAISWDTHGHAELPYAHVIPGSDPECEAGFP